MIEEGHYARIHKEAYAKAKAELPPPKRGSIVDVENIAELLVQAPAIAVIALCFIII